MCPICVAEEYGDPNFVSINLASHMSYRHKCNLDELIDRNISEEEML